MSSAELKAQGNALFSAKSFEEAGKKYTEAIQAGDEATDPKGLAVLYANRAACRLSLKRFECRCIYEPPFTVDRYMDANDDAKKVSRCSWMATFVSLNLGGPSGNPAGSNIREGVCEISHRTRCSSKPLTL